MVEEVVPASASKVVKLTSLAVGTGAESVGALERQTDRSQAAHVSITLLCLYHNYCCGHLRQDPVCLQRAVLLLPCFSVYNDMANRGAVIRLTKCKSFVTV